jgi:RNA polymerase sigma factor (sigma-70 family)
MIPVELPTLLLFDAMGEDPVETSLENLWRRVRNGDTRAWEELVRTFMRLVLAVARRTGLSQSDAEDCAQYTWYSLYRSRNAVKDPNSLPGWLIRVASRRSRHIIRRDMKENRRRQNSEEPSAPGLPDEEILRFERAALVRLALKQMDPRCRELLTALFLAPAELSYDDIARRLGIPVNSMGPTRARCLAKLRKLLEEMGY